MHHDDEEPKTNPGRQPMPTDPALMKLERENVFLALQGLERRQDRKREEFQKETNGRLTSLEREVRAMALAAKSESKRNAVWASAGVTAVLALVRECLPVAKDLVDILRHVVIG